MWHRGVYISKQYFKFSIGLCWPHDLLVAEKCQTKSHLTEVCWKNASPESACGQRTTCFHGTLLWLQLCHFSLLFANQTFGRGCADGKGMIIDCCWGIGASRNFPLFFSSNQCDNVKNFKDQFLNHKFQARTTNSSCIHRDRNQRGRLAGDKFQPVLSTCVWFYELLRPQKASAGSKKARNGFCEWGWFCELA